MEKVVDVTLPLGIRYLIEKAGLLLRLIEENNQPFSCFGLCANLEKLTDKESAKVLIAFFQDTGRNKNYPVEEILFPDACPYDWALAYNHNGLNNQLWVGAAREARIALLKEFIEWLRSAS